MGADGGSRASAFNWKTVPQGAATSVWAGIVAPGEHIGRRYCEDCRVADLDDDPGHSNGVRSYALDAGRARALWARSEAMFASARQPDLAALGAVAPPFPCPCRSQPAYAEAASDAVHEPAS